MYAQEYIACPRLSLERGTDHSPRFGPAPRRAHGTPGGANGQAATDRLVGGDATGRAPRASAVIP